MALLQLLAVFAGYPGVNEAMGIVADYLGLGHGVGGY